MSTPTSAERTDDENLQDLLADDVEQESATHSGALARESAPARREPRTPEPAESEEAGAGKARSATPKLSWAQAASITRFATTFAAAPAAQRDYAVAVFDMPDEAGKGPIEAALDLAQRLMPAGGSIHAWRLYSSLARKIGAGGPQALGWAEGAELVTALGSGGPALTRDFVRLVNLSPGSQMRPSRRAAAIEILQGAVAALTEAGEKIPTASLAFVDELLDIWPGER